MRQTGGIQTPMYRQLSNEATKRGVAVDPVIRQDLMRLYSAEVCKSLMGMRTRAEQQAGKTPGPGGSLGKLAGAMISATYRDLSLAIVGPGSVAGEDGGKWAKAALTTLVLTTGTLHEDGLADTADGFWGGHDRARRLEIMRDSRIGSYGVIALMLSLAARWAALTALFAAGSILAPLLIAAAGSRAAMAVAMHRLRHARKDGLAQSTGRPDRGTAWLAVGIAALVALALSGAQVFALAGVAVLTLATAVQICRRKIGGQTGDSGGDSEAGGAG